MKFRHVATGMGLLLTLAMCQPARAAGHDGAVFTGLVVELNDQSIKPALSVRILSDEGKVVYGDFNHLSPAATSILIDQGTAAFAKNWNEVEQRCGSNPLRVKGLSVQGEDIIVSREDAEQILQADRQVHFLDALDVAVLTAASPATGTGKTQEPQAAISITEKDLPADEVLPASPTTTESAAPSVATPDPVESAPSR